jgi:hypothetical protein
LPTSSCVCRPRPHAHGFHPGLHAQGALRASINLDNPILADADADADAASGAPGGVSVELALGVVDAAGKSADAVGSGPADIGFFAVDAPAPICDCCPGASWPAAAR